MSIRSYFGAIWRWLEQIQQQARAKKILVFISSPADCAAERRMAVDAVRRVNARPETRKSGVQFEALLWEDLPPGVAPDGDFQARINSLLKRHGLQKFGIYIGVMRSRIGTPTKRYPSGTIEEFVESLKRRRMGGAPEEVLFYFVEPYASESPSVSKYRTSLQGEYYLYQSILSDEFAGILEGHLRKIASEWFSLRKRFKRLPRQIAAPALIAVGFVAVGLLVADSLFASQIVSELGAWEASQPNRQQDGAVDVALPLQAALIYERRSTWMLRSADRTRHQLNQRASAFILKMQDVESQVAAFAAWRSRLAYDASLTDNLAGELRRRVFERLHSLSVKFEIESSTLPVNADVSLVKKAFESGLLDDDIPRDQRDYGISERLRQLLVQIAGRRMFAARVKVTPDPGQWRREEAIEIWKKEVMKEADALDARRLTPGQLLALLAEGITPGAGPSRDQIKRLVLEDSDASPMQIANFFKNWPMEKLLSAIWDLPDQLPVPIPPTAKISAAVSGLLQRDDDRPLADFLARIAAWDWPSEKFGELDLGDCSSEACAFQAAKRLNEFLSEAALAHRSKQAIARVTDVLVRSLPDGRILDEALRTSLSNSLLSIFMGRLAEPRCQLVDIVDALSKLSTEKADEYLAGRISLPGHNMSSCDLSEPIALIWHLSRRHNIPDRDDLALRLLLAAEDSARRGDISQVHLPGSPLGRYFSTAIAWLNFLATRGAKVKTQLSEDEIETLKRIIARISTAPQSTRMAADNSLRRALAIMTDSSIISLLSFSKDADLEATSDPIWERRIRIAQILGITQADRHDIAAVIALHLPEGRIADALEWELPSISKNFSKNYFHARALSGDLRSIANLLRVSDNRGLYEFVDLIAGLPRNEAHQRAAGLITIIGERADDENSDNSELLDRLIEVRGDLLDRNFDGLEYLFKAAAVAVGRLTERSWLVELAKLARDVIQGEGSIDLFAAAIQYCNNAIKNKGTAGLICSTAKFRDISALFQDANTEQYARLSSILGSYEPSFLPDSYATYALKRPLLVARDIDAKMKKFSSGSANNLSVLIMNKLVSTPLLSAVFEERNRDQQKGLEQLALGEGVVLEVHGTISDPVLAFRAYLIWQISPCHRLRSDPLSQLSSTAAELAMASAAYLARCASHPDIVQRLPDH